MKRVSLLSLSLLLAVAGKSFADDAAAPAASSAAPAPATQAAAPAATPAAATPPAPVVAPPSWKADGVLGYIAANGTGTKNQSFNAKLHGEYDINNWTHEITAQALSTQDDIAGTSTNRYLIDTKSSRTFDPTNYAYGATDWEKDLKSGYHYQADAHAGYGHYFIKDDVQHLSLEIGAGLQHSEPLQGDPENSGVGVLSLHYHYFITPTLKFSEKAKLTDGRVDTDWHSLTELKNSVTKKLALSVSYDYDHQRNNSGINRGTTTTLGIFSVNLNYTFQ